MMNDYGRIMNEIHDMAFGSENGTWFIEHEEVSDFSKKEWKEFFQDIEKFETSNPESKGAFEVFLDEETCEPIDDDLAVIIYGCFKKAFMTPSEYDTWRKETY